MQFEMHTFLGQFMGQFWDSFFIMCPIKKVFVLLTYLYIGAFGALINKLIEILLIKKSKKKIV